MPLVLRRKAGQQIRIRDRESGRVLWIEVYRRSPHTTDLDFSFKDPSNHFQIDRGERAEESIGL